MDLFDEYQTLSSLKRDGLSKPFLLGLYECAVSGKIYRSIKNTNVQSIVDVPWSSAMVVLLGEYTFLSQFDMEYGYSKKKKHATSSTIFFTVIFSRSDFW